MIVTGSRCEDKEDCLLKKDRGKGVIVWKIRLFFFSEDVSC